MALKSKERRRRIIAARLRKRFKAKLGAKSPRRRKTWTRRRKGRR